MPFAIASLLASDAAVGPRDGAQTPFGNGFVATHTPPERTIGDPRQSGVDLA